MNALREQFISEARELVLQATDDLIAIERTGFDAERLDRVFRAFHTLKGSAGVVELPAMSFVLHAAEDLLAEVNARRQPITTSLVNEALLSLDQISKWIDDFEASGALPSDAGDTARKSTERLRALLNEASAKPVESGQDSGGTPSWASRLAAEIFQLPGKSDHNHLAIEYEPLSDCFFNGDDPLRLLQSVPNLLAVSVEPRKEWQRLGELDPFVCNLRIHAIAKTTRSEVAQIFRFVPDQIRVFELPADAATVRQVDRENESLALLENILARQIGLIQAGLQDGDFYGRLGSATRVATNALRHNGRAEMSGSVESAMEAAMAQKDASLLLASLQAITKQLLAPPSGALSENKDGSATRRSLRVDEARIDAIFNLSGEMIVARNGLMHLARRMEQAAHDSDLIRDIRASNESFGRLVSDMHSAILQLRMVPVDQLFRSFPRLVRDISQRLGKNVELIARGGTTECDKNVVDRLFEPLLHLVRNALDHGVESPEARRAAGKPEIATVTLAATRSGDRLVIEITDDGRGIDPEAMRRKAREGGASAAEEIDQLSDEEAIHLIFRPGFSTASKVSDISGRGVGMDVVRNTVEQVGGRIALASRFGTGTTVRLDLPISVAMSQIMVVDAGGQSFGLPMDAVGETVRLSPDRVATIKDNKGFVLRDRIVPICSLAELMGLQLPPAKSREGQAHLLVVVEVAGRVAALEVDAIRDRLDAVLKPMQGVLSNARGYSGTTVTSDGRVLLVLDLKEILP
jgi:two-component system chemotaxis sensor kinase CheA